MIELKAKKDLDALKIDIDSFDLDLAALILKLGYKPKVIMVEMNPDIPPPYIWYQKYDKVSYTPAVLNLTTGAYTEHAPVNKGFRGNYGASASAWWNLLTKEYDYGVVHMEVFDENYKGCKRCEHNIWFVAGELLNEKGLRVMDHDEMSTAFWRSHLVPGKIGCIHVAGCPLGRLIANVKPKPPGQYLALTKKMQECPQQDFTQKFLEDEILVPIRGVCPADDSCLDHSEIYYEQKC